MMVWFDPDDESWVFDDDVEPSGAMVSVHVGGLTWVVSVFDHSDPVRVGVAAPVTPWTRAAVVALLGDGAAAVLEQARDSAGVRVAVDPGSSRERAAMGLLAVATAGRDPSPTRALDVAALIHRAGLDQLDAPFPGADTLADDTLEAIDLLPDVVASRLGVLSEDDSRAGWRVAAAGLADARAFVVRVTGDVLAGRDVDSEFAGIVADASFFLEEELAVFLADELPVFLGGPPPRMVERGPGSLEVLVVDPDIRGLTGYVTSYDPYGSTVAVSVTASPDASVVQARLVSADRGEVLAFPGFETDGARRTASVTVRAGFVPGHVELVIDPRQPVLDTATAEFFDHAFRVREGERHLRQLAALHGEDRPEVQTARVDTARLLQRPLRDGGLGLEGQILHQYRIEPSPSDGLATVCGVLRTEIIDGITRIESAAERAATAHNTTLLLRGSHIPWIQQLTHDLVSLEATARGEEGRS